MPEPAFLEKQWFLLFGNGIKKQDWIDGSKYYLCR